MKVKKDSGRNINFNIKTTLYWKEKTMYSQEDNLLIQSYFTTAFLSELHNLDFLNSKYYKDADFQDKYVQENLPSIGIGNHGSLLMILYSLLIIPKELIESKYQTEFKDLNQFVDSIKSKANSTYKNDSPSIDYIRHIRNSVAHAKVSFNSEKEVVFLDENNNGSECTIIIPLANMEQFIKELRSIFFKHINILQQEMSSK